jgi:hypothetical protein
VNGKITQDHAFLQFFKQEEYHDMKKGNKGKSRQEPLPTLPSQNTRSTAMVDKGGTPKGPPPSSLATPIPSMAKPMKETTDSTQGTASAPMEPPSAEPVSKGETQVSEFRKQMALTM